MPSVRSAFNSMTHYFTLADLKKLVELDIEPTSVLHALNVGNNVSVWFTDGNKIQSIDLYGPEVVELVNREGDWKIVHAAKSEMPNNEGVLVWLADLNSVEVPEVKEEN